MNNVIKVGYRSHSSKCYKMTQFICKYSNSSFSGSSSSNNNNSSNSTNSTNSTNSSNSSNSTSDDLRNNILKYSLQYVKELGWTNEALVKGMHDALSHNNNSSSSSSSSSSNHQEEYSSLAHAVVARGPTEMIELFIENKRIHVADIMKSYDNSDINNDQNDNIIYNSLNKALNAHIDYLGPYIHTWPGALALMADPMQVPNSISIMDGILVDLISYTNIKTKRMDWYSERALLLLVYSSVELHMISDTSDNFKDTKSFVERLLTTYIDARKSPSMITMLSYASRMIFK